ncbi:MAG TPA: DUF5317 domain-containing protein [Anaerolineaceae bacterium]
MILSAAVILGLAAGLFRAWIGKRTYRIIDLRLPGLVLFAFVPQWLAFFQTRLGYRLPDDWAPYLLVSSQVVLLVFAWLNRKQPGFLLLGSGLILNFLVIITNGGLMPISPGTVRKIYPNAPRTSWQIGKRLGSGKDIVLPAEWTNLAFLSDRWILPDWVNIQVAFSVGDVFIALGAFWLLWTLGGSHLETTRG